MRTHDFAMRFLAKCPERSRGHQAHAELAAGGREPRVRVLVVDDDPALRRLIASTLADAGLEVRTAQDGRTALELSLQAPPDVVVLDLEMPEMDGRACFRALRSRGIRAPVLILSAYGARNAASELGAEAAMDKPFDASELVHHLMSA